ncbi:hypothetical protein [Amycolatopsis aidingensis]|uniref:hypothetical protein n=1 Tax=Amycolatopsis aidingensis TaxID=2842453 RepID=UPI001C0E7ED9|nr:hypothetical protein [Amycolatopsis aidingensis]
MAAMVGAATAALTLSVGGVATGAPVASDTAPSASAAASRGTIKIDHASSTSIRGWVRDNRADGYCIQAKIVWYKGSKLIDRDYSRHACPKGDIHHFSKKPGDSRPYKKATKVKVYKCLVKDGKRKSCDRIKTYNF